MSKWVLSISKTAFEYLQYLLSCFEALVILSVQEPTLNLYNALFSAYRTFWVETWHFPALPSSSPVSILPAVPKNGPEKRSLAYCKWRSRDANKCVCGAEFCAVMARKTKNNNNKNTFYILEEVWREIMIWKAVQVCWHIFQGTQNHVCDIKLETSCSRNNTQLCKWVTILK